VFLLKFHESIFQGCGTCGTLVCYNQFENIMGYRTHSEYWQSSVQVFRRSQWSTTSVFSVHRPDMSVGESGAMCGMLACEVCDGGTQLSDLWHTITEQWHAMNYSNIKSLATQLCKPTASSLIINRKDQHYITLHTHTFNSPFSGTTRVSWYQKGKTNLDFTGAAQNPAADCDWWHAVWIHER